MTDQNQQSPAPDEQAAQPTVVTPGDQPAPVAQGAGAEARANAPSTVRSSPDLVQVMVDQWGHRGEFTRGMILNIGDINPAHYDVEHAINVGALRRLSEAEARPESWPLTVPLDAQGHADEAHRAAMRYSAGITQDVARTVTTEQGQAEPAEFSKPTLPGPENNQPAARPIVTASALEAETEGARATRVEATSGGMAYSQDMERVRRRNRSSAPNEEG